jgi:hypothetical protein
MTPADAAVLERTRAAILNVLTAVGLGIALTGLALRGRDRGVAPPAPESSRQWALGALLGLAIASVGVRRVLGARARLRAPATRAASFYRAHVAGAAVGALAVPLGLAYGYAVRPRLDAVAPFWIAALALGTLSLPRAEELEGLD